MQARSNAASISRLSSAANVIASSSVAACAGSDSPRARRRKDSCATKTARDDVRTAVDGAGEVERVAVVAFNVDPTSAKQPIVSDSTDRDSRRRHDHTTLRVREGRVETETQRQREHARVTRKQVRGDTELEGPNEDRIVDKKEDDSVGRVRIDEDGLHVALEVALLEERNAVTWCRVVPPQRPIRRALPTGRGSVHDRQTELLRVLAVPAERPQRAVELYRPVAGEREPEDGHRAGAYRHRAIGDLRLHGTWVPSSGLNRRFSSPCSAGRSYHLSRCLGVDGRDCVREPLLREALGREPRVGSHPLAAIAVGEQLLQRCAELYRL